MLPFEPETWLAAKIFQDVSGAEYFLNLSGDTIFIYPQATLNNSWHLYNYANGNYIEATVTNISSQTFLGITDLVKTVQLQAKNTSGNNIANSMNGKEIKISENYGFVQTTGFKNFPNDTTIFYLAGLSNPQAGIMNLTADSIFNFNVGDEFHSRGFWQFQLTVHDVQYDIDKIISKTFSANADTVYYLTDHCWRYENYNTGNTIINSGHDTVLNAFIVSPSSWLNKYSFQLKDTSASGFSFPGNGYLNFYADTGYLSRVKKVTHNYYYYDNFQNCFTEVIGVGVYPDMVFASGLGLIHTSDQSCLSFSLCYDSLIYYKKGAEEWGQPLSCSALLSTSEIETTSSQIKITPNPSVSDKINVTGNFQKPIVELTDLFGNNLKAKYFSSQNKIEIDLSKFSGGVYSLKIIDGKKFYTSKVVLL